MKNFVKAITLLAFAAAVAASCAGAPKTSGEQAAVTDFSAVRDRDWDLAEIRTGQKRIVIDFGEEWDEEGSEKFFTLRFDAEQISGVGAPNRYRAPYSTGDNNAVSIGLIAGTLMAPLREPEVLKEQEYFALLQKAVRWNLVREYLELYCENASGGETVLVFAPAE